MTASENTDLSDVLFLYRIGRLEADETRGELRIDGQPVAIEPKPLAVFFALIAQPMRVFSRGELLDRIWGHQHLSDNVLANAVMRLRRALGPELAASIRSVAGQGYLLDAKVERIAAGRRFASSFDLHAGRDVPGRDGYLLEAPLGSSPHSEVWLAVHSKTHDRRVFKFCSDGERLSALKREFTLYRVLRESLGERDDFARVIDANFSAPPFFLECEYGGESLADWALGDERLRSMGREDRLALFVRIARSVADAHRVGVLHKDLKPSNVLVAAASSGDDGSAPRWLTRITDFGSGRLLDAAALERLGVTQLGLTVTSAVSGDSGTGTLAYLAPELFSGAAPTVQSDLYALGVMLYQLLVGDLRRPMATGWESDIDDPLLREDIALSTQGKPSERLGSVGELADRLGRLDERRSAHRQADEEANAMAIARAALAKVRARRPWLIALSLALAGGIGATSWAWRNATTQRQAAELSSSRAEAVVAFLRDDVLGAANPWAAKTAEPETVKAAVLKAIGRADDRFSGHPAVRSEIQAAMAQLLQTYEEGTAANREWVKAVEGLRTAYGPLDARTLDASYRAAIGLARGEETNAAEALLAKTDAALHTPGATRETRFAVMSAYAHGELAMDRGRVEEGIPLIEHAVALAEASPDIGDPLRDACYDRLSALYYGAGRYKDGIRIARQWMASLTARAETPVVMLASARHRLASSLMNDGAAEEAKQLLDQAAGVFDSALGPTSVDAVMVHNDLCMRWEAVGDFDQTIRCWNALLPLADASPNLSRRIAAGMRMNIGIESFMAHRDEEALRWLQEAMRRMASIADAASFLQLANYYAACAEMRLGRVDDASARIDSLKLESLTAADPAAPWALRLRLLHAIGLAKRGSDAQDAKALLVPAIREMSTIETENSEAVLAMATAVLQQIDERTAMR